MRKCLLIFTLFWVTVSVSAQSDIIAKLKFEEAEEAYQKSDFSTTLSKLDDAEKLLGATNPKIEYLRILAQFNLVEQNQGNDFSTLTSVRQDMAHYLQNYVEAVDEDKYKEVYRLSEQLNKYPKTLDEFNSIRLAKELKRKQQLEAERQGKIDLIDKEIAGLQQQIAKLEAKGRRNKVWGVILVGAGFGTMHILNKLEKEDTTEDGYWEDAGIIGYVFGGGMVLGGISSFASTKKIEIGRVQNRIKELEAKKNTVTFSPAFDYSNRSAGISLSLRF